MKKKKAAGEGSGIAGAPGLWWAKVEGTLKDCLSSHPGTGSNLSLPEKARRTRSSLAAAM